jgi:glyoxylase-like metal-dependent hydrolase (beta-lactamase superfamily II)
MLFKQLFDSESCTYTYLIGDAGEAAIIDPVIEHLANYLEILESEGLTLRYALDTHTHADHITAMGELRDATGCETVIGSPSGMACASRHLVDGETLQVGGLELTALATPGHTNDSYSFYLASQGMVFTGDTLLIGGTGRTDFQQGDPRVQYHSLFDVLLALPTDTRVYPGHDYVGNNVSSIGAERCENPRLQVANEDEYAKIMSELKLDNPRLMDIAVSANEACGKI